MGGGPSRSPARPGPGTPPTPEAAHRADQEPAPSKQSTQLSPSPRPRGSSACALVPRDPAPQPQGEGLRSGLLEGGTRLRRTVCACLAKGQPPAVWPVSPTRPHSIHTLHMQALLAHPHADTCANTPLAAPTPTPTPPYKGQHPWHRNPSPSTPPPSPHHLPSQLSLGRRTRSTSARRVQKRPPCEGTSGGAGPVPGPGCIHSPATAEAACWPVRFLKGYLALGLPGPEG